MVATALIVVLAVVALALILWASRLQTTVRAQQQVLAKPRVAEAVMVAASVRKDKTRAKAIEAAMGNAVADALRRGVKLTDADTLRAEMLAARERVLRGDQ